MMALAGFCAALGVALYLVCELFLMCARLLDRQGAPAEAAVLVRAARSGMWRALWWLMAALLIMGAR